MSNRDFLIGLEVSRLIDQTDVHSLSCECNAPLCTKNGDKNGITIFRERLTDSALGFSLGLLFMLLGSQIR